MADRRITQVLVEAEYATPRNDRRVTQVLVMPEYKGATNFRRITQVLLQVEYYRPWIGVIGRVQGPPAQVI